MSDKPTCKTCPCYNKRWFASGDCRRKPPIFAKAEVGEEPYGKKWVIVDDSDWCGEHPDFKARGRGLPPETIKSMERELDKSKAAIFKKPPFIAPIDHSLIDGQEDREK
jgi:hypothetical protein